MSEQNTTPAAAPAKPKRPKSKSQLMAGALLDKAYNDAIEARTELLHSHLDNFIRARTAHGHEDTPPLGDYITDEDWQEGEAS